MHPKRTASPTALFNQVFNRHPLREWFGALADLFDPGKHLFQINVGASRHQNSGQFSAPCNSNPLAAARPFHQFGQFLLGLEYRPTFFIVST